MRRKGESEQEHMNGANRVSNEGLGRGKIDGDRWEELVVSRQIGIFSGVVTGYR